MILCDVNSAGFPLAYCHFREGFHRDKSIPQGNLVAEIILQPLPEASGEKFLCIENRKLRQGSLFVFGVNPIRGKGSGQRRNCQQDSRK